MKQYFFRVFLCLISLIIIFTPVRVNSNLIKEIPKSYDYYINDWVLNNDLAAKYLREAEQLLKKGDSLKACKAQILAANYGVKGSHSLINAYKIYKPNNIPNEIYNILLYWEKLSSECL